MNICRPLLGGFKVLHQISFEFFFTEFASRPRFLDPSEMYVFSKLGGSTASQDLVQPFKNKLPPGVA